MVQNVENEISFISVNTMCLQSDRKVRFLSFITSSSSDEKVKPLIWIIIAISSSDCITYTMQSIRTNAISKRDMMKFSVMKTLIMFDF